MIIFSLFHVHIIDYWLLVVRNKPNNILFSDISFEEKIPMPKAADVCQPLPPINSYARPPRKAWDLPVLTNEVLSDHQIGRKPLSLEIRQT